SNLLFSVDLPFNFFNGKPYSFSNAEYADIYFIYGLCNVVEEYDEFSKNIEEDAITRKSPNREVFKWAHPQFREYCLTKIGGDRQNRRRNVNEREIFNLFTNNPKL
ncbi:hypothetical protein HHI36_004753, partial [Cryptolaemus montrouzieri]